MASLPTEDFEELGTRGLTWVDVIMALLSVREKCPLSLHMIIAEPEETDLFHQTRTRESPWLSEKIKDYLDKRRENKPEVLSSRPIYMDWHIPADVIVTFNPNSDDFSVNMEQDDNVLVCSKKL